MAVAVAVAVAVAEARGTLGSLSLAESNLVEPNLLRCDYITLPGNCSSNET